MELGIGVLRPSADERYDLVFDLRSEFVRVQCKWAARVGDTVVLRCQRCRRTANGLVKRSYAREDVDAFAFYCPDTRCCYFLRFEEVAPGGEMRLRLSPTLNNQARRVHWARDFEFGATLRPLGAVAQLGERRAGSAQAAGSSPAGSTSDAGSAADAACL